MGTRADFYIGTLVRVDSSNLTLTKHKWLGSIGWDGSPLGHGPPKELLEKTKEPEFLEELEKFKAKRKENGDWTEPSEHGWPWPWETSSTTDWAYIFNPKAHMVQIVNFSRYNGGYKKYVRVLAEHEKWRKAVAEHQEKGLTSKLPKEPKDEFGTVAFPDMSAIKNVTYDEGRSGLMIVGF